MKTVKIKIHCGVCGKFETTHEIDINKHGYFVFPTAFCPNCLAILEAVIDYLPEDVL